MLDLEHKMHVLSLCDKGDALARDMAGYAQAKVSTDEEVARMVAAAAMSVSACTLMIRALLREIDELDGTQTTT